MRQACCPSSAAPTERLASAPDAAQTGGDGSISGTCAIIPEETAGPYPGDGSNGKNALTQSGIVRGDIRTSFAGATGVATGVPLTIKLKLVDTRTSCAALVGYAIYLWHCDRDGNYSMYSSAIASENYLRGVQETDADGTVAFRRSFQAATTGGCRTCTSRCIRASRRRRRRRPR